MESGGVQTTDHMKAAEGYEKLAFQFCKIATFALIAQRFALPAAATLAAIFFVAAYAQGKRTSRCFVRYPLLIAGLWALVVAGWAAFYFNPELRNNLVQMLPWMR